MATDPDLVDFERRTLDLAVNEIISHVLHGDEIALGSLGLEGVNELLKLDEGYYFLIAAAGLNRTSLRRATRQPDVAIAAPELRRAHAIASQLPVRDSFSSVVQKSIALRSRDLQRKRRGAVEQLLRDRLASEHVPLRMSPPVPVVPGILIGGRKPDGVYPDPGTGRAPRLYLEVKNIRRVADDIQKRLYEVAEASLEMKTIYGRLSLKGLNRSNTAEVANNPVLQRRVRRQITKAEPVVVAFFICSRDEAERYRAGAEAFVDRLFFQEEVDDCISFLRDTILGFESENPNA